MGDFLQKLQARRINSKYYIVEQIGKGGHAAVYLGGQTSPFHYGIANSIRERFRHRCGSCAEAGASRYRAINIRRGGRELHRIRWVAWIPRCVLVWQA